MTLSDQSEACFKLTEQSQGDKSSRAQILKKASEYIAFMRRKNGSHSSDIEDLRRQNNHLENQVSEC